VTLGPLVPAPIAADQSWRTPEETTEARRRLRATAGIVAVALGILGVVVWIVFLSPYSFSRFPLADQYRTFNAHQGGSYVVYLEFPGESRASLPPALDVSASSLSGQRIQVRRVGQLGEVGAPDAYHVGRYEGRAIATVTVSGGGAFLLTIDHRPVSTADADQELPVTEGTIAVGRAWGRGWATGLWFAAVLFVVPMAIGIGLLASSRRRRQLR
jgi:hypothetical protein